ncbi:hypothetical protein PC117_g7937 [Phytophthora cactorum]|uniref:Uncharacterized protein n=1 Tax=Phytophthora cactorum TaxID=29920 RepID=A0A8T1E3I6_9STRA|nr:hypothetical protein PC117_g7937 [Phytophthora cactorum]
MKPEYANYLGARADIVHSPDFESGCVRVVFAGLIARVLVARRHWSSLSLSSLEISVLASSLEFSVPLSLLEFSFLVLGLALYSRLKLALSLLSALKLTSTTVTPKDGATDTTINAAVTLPGQILQERVQVLSYPERVRTPVDASHSSPTSRNYCLLVQPIVKATVGQRATSGDTLDGFIASGSSFQDIRKQLWEKFRQHVKGRAVKTHGTWSVEPASIDIWISALQFKAKSVHPSASTQHSNDKNPNQATSNESSTSQISGKLNHEITNPGVTDVRANPNDSDERANPDSNNKILPRAGAPASITPPTTRVTRTQRATSTMAAAIEQNTCSQSCNNEIFSHSCNNECGKCKK